MFRIARAACLFAAVVVASSCAQTVAPSARERLSAEDAAVLERCRGARRVEIFEGLPHQDSAAFHREKQRPDTFVSHGFAFYRPAMNLSAKQARDFAAPLVESPAHSPWGGDKFCGRYHPDYMLRFHDAAGCVEMHFCLGCGEAVFHGGATRMKTDIDPKVRQPYELKFDSRRQKRPSDPAMLPPSAWLSGPHSSPVGIERNAIDALLDAAPPAR